MLLFSKPGTSRFKVPYMEDFKAVENGDLVLHLNRGVADSLFEPEISEIIAKFVDAELDLKDRVTL